MYSGQAPHDGERPGLRERKAAATRLAIARALSERLTERSLSDITADELAEAAGVSRVTFFNYFPTKEHAIDHVFATWLFEEHCESQRKGLTGAEAILHLFDAMGTFVAESPRRSREVLAWFAGRPIDRPAPSLTRAEREQIAPDLPHEQLAMLRDRFPVHVAEARAAGELATPGSDYEIGHMLGVLLFGGGLVGHSKPNQDWRALFRHHAQTALGMPATKRTKQPRRKR